MYQAIINPVIDYNAAAWQPWLSKSNIDKIDTIKRTAARKITGLYVSTPSEALFLEAGIHPTITTGQRHAITSMEKTIRLQADNPKFQIANKDTKQRTKKRQGWRNMAKKMLNEIVNKNTPRIKWKHNQIPPWQQTKKKISVNSQTINPVKPDDSIVEKRMKATETINASQSLYGYNIFTDGSAEAGTNNGGAAAIITVGNPNNPNIIDTIKRPTGTVCTSFHSECVAMEIGLQWLLDQNPQNSPTIFTDSKSLTEAMGKDQREQKDPSLIKLWQIIDQLPVDVKVQWIPAHCDVKGNEAVDKAAKEATKMDQNNAPLNFNAVKRLIQREIQPPPIAHPRLKKTYTRRVPHPDELHMTAKDRHIIRALRTGHFKGLKAYQNRLNPDQDPQCEDCQSSVQDSTHIWECEAHTNRRRAMLDDPYPNPSILAEDPKRAIPYLRAVYPNWFA